MSLCVVACALTSCFDTGSSSKSSNLETNDSVSDVTGHLFFSDPGEYSQFNLTTRKTTMLFEADAYGVQADVGLVAALFKTPLGSSNSYTQDQLVVLNKYGEVEGNFILTENISSPFRFSPSGSSILFRWSPHYHDDTIENGIAVFALTGEQLHHIAYDNSSLYDVVRIYAYDWIDDYSFVYALGGNIYKTRVGSALSPELIYAIDESIFDEYEINWVDVDNAGKRIVFTVGLENSNDDRVYWMNLENPVPVQLTHSSLNEMNPVWSPDGQYVAFQYGYPSSIHGPGVENGCPQLYVVRADDKGPYLVPSDETESIIPVMHKSDLGDTVQRCAWYAMEWGENGLVD